MADRRACTTSPPMSSPSPGGRIWSRVALKRSRCTTLRQVRGGSRRSKLKRNKPVCGVDGRSVAPRFISTPANDTKRKKREVMWSFEGGDTVIDMRYRAPRGPYRYRRQWRGGEMPWVIDFKKGWDLITDKQMWNLKHVFKKPSPEEIAKFKRERESVEKRYRMYKDAGGSLSKKKWMTAKGFLVKPTFTFPGFG